MPGFRGAREIHYDPEHARTRKQAFAALPEYSPCCRCGHTMWKWAKTQPDRRGVIKSALHWDHNRARTGYLGFSHGTPCPTCGQRCNIKDGAAQGARVANARRTTRPTHARTTPHDTPPRWHSQHW